mmetsp:Transcript_34533/g.101337  ORF Transcript_34533/g.101337 Transcript_34533/m.101337 type:complete len:229 (-) Transcript_34533:192-878(-)
MRNANGKKELLSRHFHYVLGMPSTSEWRCMMSSSASTSRPDSSSKQLSASCGVSRSACGPDTPPSVGWRGCSLVWGPGSSMTTAPSSSSAVPRATTPIPSPPAHLAAQLSIPLSLPPCHNSCSTSRGVRCVARSLCVTVASTVRSTRRVAVEPTSAAASWHTRHRAPLGHQLHAAGMQQKTGSPAPTITGAAGGAMVEAAGRSGTPPTTLDTVGSALGSAGGGACWEA